MIERHHQLAPHEAASTGGSLVILLVFMAVIAYGFWALMTATSSVRQPSVESVSWTPAPPEMLHWAVTGEAPTHPPRVSVEYRWPGPSLCLESWCQAPLRVTAGSAFCWCGSPPSEMPSISSISSP